MRQINEAGLNLIKHAEGCRLQAYQDTAGIWTIGYGHTKGVQPGQNITQDQAEAFLLSDVIQAEIEVQTYITAPITDNMFSALTSLVFNCGMAPLTMHLGEYLNNNQYDEASNEFLKWNHIAGKVSEGLSDRRAAERALFLTK